MKKLKPIQKAPMIIACVGILILSIYNLGNNIGTFFDASLASILDLFSILAISFYLTQIMSERRDRNDHIERLLRDICNLVNSEELFNTEDENKKSKARILQRKLANKIDILKEYNLSGKAGDEVKSLDEKYKGVRDLFGNHVNESDFKNKFEVDIANYIEKIESCCDRINHELYK